MEKLTYSHDSAAAETLAAYYETPPMAYVRSYGCQQNVNDGEKIRGVLQDVGFGLCDSLEDADLILFNTCAVREHAEQRVFGNIGALKKLKEQNPKLVIGVCGCMAQQPHIVEKLRQSYPYVDLVFGVDGIDRLPAMLAERLRRGKRYLQMPEQRNAVVEELPIRRDSGFRAWLPIMYGCDNFCTYCIVPYVRGRERSREPGAILAEFRDLVANGYKEITLLGQNVNSYGKGLAQPVDFADLLNLLCEVPGDYQIRFMTSHPKDASRKLIDTIAAQPHLCKHIHLPVQSGSDRVLQQMNRRYTAEQYKELVRYAGRRSPGSPSPATSLSGSPARRRRISPPRWIWCGKWAICSCSPSSIQSAAGPRQPECRTPSPMPKKRRGWNGCCACRMNTPLPRWPPWPDRRCVCWWKRPGVPRAPATGVLTTTWWWNSPRRSR